MGVKIFVSERDDRYNVFFGHELMGHINKTDLQADTEILERTLRAVCYKYTNFVNSTGEFKPQKPVVISRSVSRKKDGILKEIWGWFW